MYCQIIIYELYKIFFNQTAKSLSARVYIKAFYEKLVC